MDKWQAVQSFWESFNLPAIDENSATDRSKLKMPYITYSAPTGRIDDQILFTASLWYRSSSWKDISRKADEIAQAVGDGIRVKRLNNGYLWLKPGTPFSQRMKDDDPQIRRVLINISAEYLTAY